MIIFATSFKRNSMIGFEEQLELINLKERIANNSTMSNRIASLLGQNKGWNELGEEWHLNAFEIRGLKNMALCELCYSKKEFSIMRKELYSKTKEEILKNARKPLAVIVSTKTNVEIRIKSPKPLLLITSLKNKLAEYTSTGNGKVETLQIKHDTNAPIFIMGEIVELECVGQRLNECCFRHLSSKLRRIDLTGNQITVEDASKIVSQLPPFSKQDLFDEEPILCLSLNIPHEVYTLARLKQWKIINSKL